MTWTLIVEVVLAVPLTVVWASIIASEARGDGVLNFRDGDES